MRLRDGTARQKALFTFLVLIYVIGVGLALDDKSQRIGQIDVGMGIHTGYATCGFIGYEGRRDYSVIGNVTNLAARLSDAAGGGEILITARVMAELRNGGRTEPVGELTLKGFQQAQAVFRLVPPASSAT